MTAQRPSKIWQGSALAELTALGTDDGLEVRDFGVVQTGTPGLYQATTVLASSSTWTLIGGGGGMIDLQGAYDNGAAIVTDAAGGPIQISGTQGFEISAPSSSGLVEADEITLRATGVSDFFIDAPNGVIFDGAKQINATLPFKFDDGAGGFQIVRGADPVAANDLATKNYVDSTAGAVVEYVQFSRKGATSSSTFLRVDEVNCSLPSGSDGAAGFPVESSGTTTITRISWRSKQAPSADTEFELFRCEGNGITGTSVSILTETIPAGSYEHVATISTAIPAGSWTLVARRTALGGSGSSVRWEESVTVLKMETT